MRKISDKGAGLQRLDFTVQSPKIDKKPLFLRLLPSFHNISYTIHQKSLNSAKNFTFLIEKPQKYHKKIMI